MEKETETEIQEKESYYPLCPKESEIKDDKKPGDICECGAVIVKIPA